jgi:hypothetical protein
MSDDQADNLKKGRPKKALPAEVEELSDLVAYLDGELDDSSLELIERRLVDDIPLRRSAETLDRTWQLLDTLEDAEASGDFTQNTLASIAAAGAGVDVDAAADTPVLSKSGGSTFPWRPAVSLFAVSFLTSTLTLAITRWNASAATPDSDRILLQNLDVLKDYDACRLVPNVQFLRELRLPEGISADTAADVPGSPDAQSNAPPNGTDRKGAQP